MHRCCYCCQLAPDKATIKLCDEVETYNKNLLFGNSYFVQSLMNHLAGVSVEPQRSNVPAKQDTVGPLVIMGVLQTLEGCLCSRMSTTGHIEFQQLVDEVAKYYRTILKILFQSRCATTVEACKLLFAHLTHFHSLTSKCPSQND